MAYGVMNPEPGILDEGLQLEKDQQFQSLDPSMPIRPPAAADLRAALDNLIEQGLDRQYPAHPNSVRTSCDLQRGCSAGIRESSRGAGIARRSRGH